MPYRIFGALFLILLASCGGSEEPQQTFDTTPESGQPVADKGTQLFLAKCATCHGADGTAGIGNAANLHNSSLDSASVVFVMKNGRGAMPPFKDQLSEEDVQKLAAYVSALRK